MLFVCARVGLLARVLHGGRSSEDVNSDEMMFVRELLPPLKETSLWSSVYLIVYIYIFIFFS